MTSEINKLFPRRSKNPKEQETQANNFTPEEKLVLRQAINAEHLPDLQDGDKNLEPKCELLQKEAQQKVREKETSKSNLEKQTQLASEFVSQEADLSSLESQLNQDPNDVLLQREILLESFKNCEHGLEKTKENLQTVKQLSRIVMEENIGSIRQLLINRQEVMSAIVDVHDRIIQALNNLLQRENLTNDDAKQIRTTMEFFNYANMKNCLQTQVISLEVDARELDMERERLLNQKLSLYKRLEKLKIKYNILDEIPLQSSELSHNPIATPFYQSLDENREENQKQIKNRELALTEGNGMVSSETDGTDALPNKGKSACSAETDVAEALPNKGKSACSAETDVAEALPSKGKSFCSATDTEALKPDTESLKYTEALKTDTFFEISTSESDFPSTTNCAMLPSCDDTSLLIYMSADTQEVERSLSDEKDLNCYVTRQADTKSFKVL